MLNQVDVLPRRLFVSNNSSSKAAIVEVRAAAGATSAITASRPVFLPAGSNLVADVCTTGVTHTSGGRLIASLVVGALSQEQVNLDEEAVVLPPTLSLYVFGKMSSGTPSDVDVALSWYEDV